MPKNCCGYTLDPITLITHNCNIFTELDKDGYCKYHKSQKKCCNGLTEIEIMPEGYIHYSKLVCKDCRKYIKWMKRPISDDNTPQLVIKRHFSDEPKTIKF